MNQGTFNYNLRSQLPGNKISTSNTVSSSNTAVRKKSSSFLNDKLSEKPTHQKGPMAGNPPSDSPSAKKSANLPPQPSGIDGPVAQQILQSIDEMKSTLNNKLDFVIAELNGMKDDLAETKRNVTEIEASLNFTDEKISKIENETIPTLKESIKKHGKEFEDKIILMELHQRKQNLIIYGIPDAKMEDIRHTTRDIMSHFLDIPLDEAAKIPLINAHRLPASKPWQHNTTQQGNQPSGKSSQRDPVPSPIIIRFSSMFDRDRLLRAYETRSRQRPGTPSTPPSYANASATPVYTRVSIRTDIPARMKKERGRLAAMAYELRRERKVATRIKITGTTVILQTRKHNQDGLSNSPWITWAE